MMKNKETEIRKLNELSADDIDRVDYIMTELKSFKYNKEITEKTVDTLNTLTQMLSFMRQEHSKNLLTWLKQGYLIEG